MHARNGFTIIELLIVIAILGLLLGVVFGLSSAKREQELRVITDTIVFTLEEAKANAIAGKYGTPHGIAFNTGSYTLFSGSTFSASGEHNRTHHIADRFTIQTTFGGTHHAVIFARITGAATPAGSITVTDVDQASNSSTITIGTGGDITATY